MAQSARLSIDEFLLSLQHVKAHGDQWQAQCPAHEDSRASLSVSLGRSGAILVNCFAGCTFSAILNALNLTAGSLSPQKVPSLPQPRLVATYDYKDARGELRYQVCRFEPKDFRQRRPNGGGGWLWNMQGITKIPYRLNELLGHSTVYIPEGEKDVDALWKLGQPATCNVGGVGKWRDSDTQALKNLGISRVIVLPDNDGPGRKHADDIAKQMKAARITYSIIELPGLHAKGDVSDWFAQGHQLAELHELAAKPHIVQGATALLPSADIDGELARLRSRTDSGQAELFAAMFGAEFRYNHFREMWLHYESPCWRTDADKAIYRAAREFARAQQCEALEIADRTEKKDKLDFAMKAESGAKLEALVKAASWNEILADKGENWDTDPWALATNNGVIDLRTGILRPGDPSDRITMKCTVAYNPKAECPRWWQFLAEIFGGDESLIDYIWRLCGYILTGETTERIVPMFYGRGANGKSVLINVLATILGDYATALPFSSLQFQKQEGIPNDMAGLAGRRLVTMVEANDGLRLNEAKLKSLSGNDRISARFLHGEFFTFQPVAKFVLAMNHKPIAKDDSEGFWDRIHLVPFNHTFPPGERDAGLQARLIAEEGEGILAWAVYGCLRWKESGLRKPPAVVAATEEYQAESDQLAEFIGSEFVNMTPDGTATTQEIGKTYNLWADQRGLSKVERLNSTQLGRLLGARFRKKKTNKTYFYTGLEVISGKLAY